MQGQTLQGANCSKAGMAIKKFLIQNPNARMGIFATKLFGQGINDGFYYGPLVFAHPIRLQHNTLTYEENFIEMKSNMIQKPENRLDKNVFDRKSVKYLA